MSASTWKTRLRGTRRAAERSVNRLLHRGEHSWLTCPDALAHAPIFILGAPRSGTTLLYQLMVEYFDVGYLSNAHVALNGSPALVQRLVHPGRWRRHSRFASRYGAIEGWASPSEAGPYWYRFFPKSPHHAGPDALSVEQLRDLRSSMAAIISAFDRPVVFKNVNNSVRLAPLARALPEALFLVSRRDLVDNGQSLLEGRIKVHGDVDDWFSVEPPDVERIRALPPSAQVIDQIVSVRRCIEAVRAVVGEHRFMDVHYESLCARPHETLRTIGDFLSPINPRADAAVPVEFPVRNDVRIDQQLYDDMKRYAEGRIDG